jgi:hypothetical protein
MDSSCNIFSDLWIFFSNFQRILNVITSKHFCDFQGFKHFVRSLLDFYKDVPINAGKISDFFRRFSGSFAEEVL